MTDQISAEICGQVLDWDRRLHAVMGRPHEHRCKLGPGHPASGPGFVPIHECGSCTLCWESEPRPRVHCTCQASPDPRCPTHGTPPGSAQPSSTP